MTITKIIQNCREFTEINETTTARQGGINHNIVALDVADITIIIHPKRNNKMAKALVLFEFTGFVGIFTSPDVPNATITIQL